MELFFSPLACSMASRIAFYEAGAEPRFNQVDPKRKRAADDVDFYTVNPMGQVPTLRLDDGAVLTENAVVLQYIADRFPTAGLVPPAGSVERYRAQEWLNFIGTELHKAIFIPLLDPKAAPGAKEFARSKIERSFGRLNAALEGRETLLDRFTVADAYLVTVLNWGAYSGVDLAQWPAVQAFYQRTIKRPAVARALTEEFRLYKEEVTRHAAA